jgi:hypothetical protein
VRFSEIAKFRVENKHRPVSRHGADHFLRGGVFRPPYVSKRVPCPIMQDEVAARRFEPQQPGFGLNPVSFLDPLAGCGKTTLRPKMLSRFHVLCG